MLKLKYFLEKNKILIMVIAIVLICSIAIAFGVYAQVTNRSSVKQKTEKELNDYVQLKNNFQDIFNNTINKEATAKININYEDILHTKYNISEEEDGKYSINAKIPNFKGETETISNINTEIFDIFAKKIVKIVKETSAYTTYNLDYVAYVNNNIISLVIRCKYKDGANPQRTIIKTYNYDIENDKLLNIDDIIAYKNLNKEEMQKKVQKEIKQIKEEEELVSSQIESVSEQKLNVYTRDEESAIYKIENTPDFFLGKNNYLYLVYAYGNNNHTSEIDLVIF